MRVICVDSADRPNETDMGFDLKEGEVYTVIEEFESLYGEDCYALAEDPNNDEWGFQKDRFIPLSNLNELELVNEKQLVNQ